MGFNDFIKKLFGSKHDRDIRRIQPMVEEVNRNFEKYKSLSNDELRTESKNLKLLLRNSIEELQQTITTLKKEAENEEDFDKKEDIYREVDKLEEQITKQLEDVLLEILPQGFAIVKETARRFTENNELAVTATDFDRNLAAKSQHVVIKGNSAVYSNTWLAGGNPITWNMVHYDVQLIGGVILHEGKIAEMATGEGKTLVATLPVFLNALTGRGVHVVTVNDYLAKRDSEWNSGLFHFHELLVDCIDKHEPNSDARRKAYEADITYGTNNEFGFDYLRDNMAISPQDLVQRKHNYAIVDEVDSVLIDDARTPLIISGQVRKQTDDRLVFEELKGMVVKIYTEQRKFVTQILSESKKLINDKKNDQGGILLLRAHKGLPKNNALIKFLSEPGIKTLLQKTENIYMAESNKRMPEITDDLFFVIDEQHNSIELTDKGIDLLSKDTKDPSFFILPDIGSRIAELEKLNLSTKDYATQKDELLADYAIKSERVHTMNQLLKAYTLFEKDREYVVIENKVKIVDEQTGRIMEGRRYSDGLHQAIEAKENVKIEASTQTMATITLQNYFRMYSKLAGMTGTAETEAGEFWSIYKLDVAVIPTNKSVVRKDREDLVYRTRREKYNAVIDEIEDLIKHGRPVLVGTTSVDVSELLSRMLKLRNIKHNVLNAKLHQREADIVAEAGQSKTVTIATNMAGRGTDIKLSQDVKDAGGLAIIGTERHESRRVDRQLRGRAGRQGDPGSSQFFVSLEDDLMRMFGSDRIAKVMDRIGYKEGEVIQHSMITKSIERAQKKVEENNFGIRKNLLEYDDEMNKQREVIYKKRRHALFGERLKVDIANMLYDTCNTVVEEHYGNSPYTEFSVAVMKLFTIEPPVDEKEYIKININEIVERLYQSVIETYKRKNENIVTKSFPVVSDVYQRMSHQYEDILVPITDRLKTYNIPVNLRRAFETQGKEVVTAFEKVIILHTIDEAWKEHLREMDELRQSVRTASYEQKDPLLIYKLESFSLFQTMLKKINKDVVSVLMKGQLVVQQTETVREAEAPKRQDYSKFNTQKRDFDEQRSASTDANKAKVTFVRTDPKVGRNDPCPCGSGKKYKQCHGKNE